MTGYGRSEHDAGRVLVESEVRSVNARHLTVRCRVPGEWVRLEPRLEGLVKGAVRRGTVDVFLRVKLAAGPSRPRVDRDVLAVYHKALDELGGGEHAELLRLPGVISLEEPSVSVRTVERAAVAAMRASLEALAASREAEGQRLEAVVRRELKALRRHLAVVRRLAPRAVQTAARALRRRLEALLDGRALDGSDPVLMREVAVLADRADVTEEIDRLDSHFTAAEALLDGRGPVGKEFDFLLQEIGREVNTLGAKSSDVRITERVVQLKSAVERLREQAANIE